MIKWDKKNMSQLLEKRVTESNDIMPRCIEKLKLQQLCNMVFLISDIPFSHTLTHIYNCSVKQLIELMKNYKFSRWLYLLFELLIHLTQFTRSVCLINVWDMVPCPFAYPWNTQRYQWDNITYVRQKEKRKSIYINDL